MADARATTTVTRMDGVDSAAGRCASMGHSPSLPAERRRCPGTGGAAYQTTLLADRLRWAAAHGCDLAVVTTMPGSKSQENVLRRGFERLYTRAITGEDR